MKKFMVNVYRPSSEKRYVVEAKDVTQAEEKAIAEYKKHIDPIKLIAIVVPEIVQIVERRINVGIAGSAEEELYYRGDLVDEEYTPEFKRQLLAEVEEAEKRAKAQPKRESNADWLTPKPAKKK